MSQLADTWKGEFQDRLRDTHVRPKWKADTKTLEISLPPIKAMILTNIFRESVTNALKHATPETIAVVLEKRGKKLQLIIRNDGKVTSPEHWTPCSGLSGMRSRIQFVGGEIQFQHLNRNDKEWIQIKAVVPIE